MIVQNDFFEGLDFTECEFEYGNEKRKCFKGKDGGYYRIDHFGNYYVIEFAENENEAKMNRFEDADLFNDTIKKENLIKLIKSALKRYIKTT